MKFGAHQTFHLRDTWLYKGLHSFDVLRTDEAVIELGVGKNMVSSMRYWLEALGLASQNKGLHVLSPMAEAIVENDPYIELDGTLVLLHYMLASNKDEATTWYWFFNKFGATEFDMESLQVYLSTFVQNNSKKKVQEATLTRDLNCLLRMYKAPDYTKSNPETDNPSPFVKFGLLEQENKKYFKKKFTQDEVDPVIFTYLLHLFWKEHLGAPESMNLEEVVEKECSPGLILGFNVEDVVEMVERINKEYPGKYLEFNRTGGYSIINMKRGAKNALLDYYNHNLELVE